MDIQAYAPETGSLHIEVHRGFQEPFLEFFDSVDAGHAACGTALKSKGRVCSRHSEQLHFLGTGSLEVMLDAGIRAFQSTPLIGKSGDVWGMLSTHYRRVTEPGKKDLLLIDYFAGWAAEILEAEHYAAHSDARSSIPDRDALKTPAGVSPALDALED